MDKRPYEPPGAFVTHLERQGLPSHRAPEQREELTIYWLDLTPLKVYASHLTPVVELKAFSGERHRQVLGEQLLDYVDLLKGVRLDRQRTKERKRYVVLVLGGALYQVPPQLEQELKTHRIAVIDRKTIRAIQGHMTPDKKFTELSRGLTRFLGLQLMSPYAIGKPVSGSQFFGRDQLLDKILGSEGENFTLYGNRQIGKTSLMREIEHQLRIGDSRTRVARMYSSEFDRPEDYLEEIVRQLEPRFHDKRTRPIFQTFAEEVQAIPNGTGDPVAVFLDEFDRILELERYEGNRMLDILRKAFDHEECRVFLAGFRRVRDAALEVEHPLRNFSHPSEVRALTEDETTRMIQVPTQRLGIPLVRSVELATAVYQETSGHPALVQIFCTALVDHYAAHGKVPGTNEFVAQVLAGSAFYDAINRAFLANTSLFEKLICYLLIGEALESEEGVEDFEFSDGDIERLVEERGLELRDEEVKALVSHLETGGIMARVPGAGGRYEFSVPQLARPYRAEALEKGIRQTLCAIESAVDRESALLG